MEEQRYANAHHLALLFAQSAALPKPWDFGEAFGFFKEKDRLGQLDLKRVESAIGERDRTQSVKQFWIMAGFSEPLKPKKKSVSKEEILAELQKGRDG